MPLKPRIPALLIALRAIAGALMLTASLAGFAAPWLLVALLWLGVLSDIFDGIIARRLGVATPTLRRADSQTDLFFFLCTLASAAILHPAVMRPLLIPIAILIALEAACYLASWAKFRRETCTHALSAKLFGLSLLAAFTAILGWGVAGPAFWIMFACGIATDLDILLIIALLPKWQNDIPSAWHAWRLRRGLPIRRHRLFN